MTEDANNAKSEALELSLEQLEADVWRAFWSARQYASVTGLINLMQDLVE